MAGSSEHSNESSGSTKGGESIDKLSVLSAVQEILCSS
jgi:hypothetical protein